MYDVITIGSAMRDVILQSRQYKIVRGKQFETGVAEAFTLGAKIDVDKLHIDVGGGGINSATTFARQGLRVAYLGKIGTDEPGSDLKKHLLKEGIATALITQDKSITTGYSTILSVPSGERTVLVYRSPSQIFTKKDIAIEKLEANWFYIASLSGQIGVLETLIRFAKKNRIKVAINPGSDEIANKKLLPLVRDSAVLIMNREEALALCPTDKRKQGLFAGFAGLTSAIVVITNGTKGAACSDGRKTYYVPVAKHGVVDRLGAGDAFGSGFVAGLIRRDGDIHFAMQLAATNASSVCMQYGANAGIIRLHDSIVNVPIREGSITV